MSASSVFTDYFSTGTHAARPVTPNFAAGVTGIYFETDTTNWFGWTGSAWAQLNTGGASPALSVSTKTTTYTITSSDDVILADASGGAFTVTVPTAVGWTKRITVLKIDSSANAVTVATTSSQTINLQSTRLLKGQFSAATLASDNANWRVTEEALPLTTKGDLLVGLGANDVQRLAVGTDTFVLTADSTAPTGVKWTAAAPLFSAYICVVDQKTSGTDGGTFTLGAWQKRDLNTKLADTGSHASVASNQITLDAGTYACHIRCPAVSCGRHAARLQNITGSATLLDGMGQYLPNSILISNVSSIAGLFTLGVASILEVQHRCEVTEATNGFGIAAGSGFAVGHEIYTIAEFWKE